MKSKPKRLNEKYLPITLVKLNGRTTKGWIVQSSMLSRVEKHDQKYLKM